MAVNSYRFIAMYLIIGMLVGTMTAFVNHPNDVQKGYDLNTEQRMTEAATDTEEVFTNSEDLVQANAFQISNSYLDEKSGGKFLAVLRGGFLPTGLIPEGFEVTELEQGINKIVIWFRWIIMLFAGFEIFQILVKPKTT